MKIFKFLLILSIFTLNGCNLSPIESEININTSKNVLKKYKRLKHFIRPESETVPNKAYLLINGSNFKDEVKSIKIYFPKYMNSLLDIEGIQLCTYEDTQNFSKINCANRISLLTEINKSKLYIEIIPRKFFSKEKYYAVKVNISDKKKKGIYQVNLFSTNLSNEDEQYLGSWRLDLR